MKVTGVDAVTVDVLTVTEALDEPAGTVTDAGVDATAALLLEIATGTPVLLEATAPVRTTVNVVVCPPVREERTFTLEITGALTVKIVVLRLVPIAAAIDTGVSATTGNVPMEKPMDVDPAGTTTVSGTVAAAVFELDSDTVMPPLGAGLVRVTVPCAPTPPVTLLDRKLTPLISGAATVSSADFVPVLRVAETVTPVLTGTGLVKIVNVPVVCPAAIVMGNP